MARLDQVRWRITLTDDELDVLRAVHEGEPVEAALVEPLREAGLVGPDGAVDPLVVDLVAVISEPMISCSVESSGPQGPVSALLAVREETVWYTDPWPQDALDDPVTYYRDELPQLLWILARLTGLRRHEVPRAAVPFTVPLRAIDAVVQTMSLAEGAWEPARTVATASLEQFFGEVADPDRTMLMATLSHLRASTRVTMVWGPDASTDARGLALWDCGDGGYWVRSKPAEPLADADITPTTLATFTPVTGGEVWRALADLLPSSAELRALVERLTVA